MNPDIQKYIENLSEVDREIGQLLANQILLSLPNAENKIWHAHPVWFLDGNPIVGFSKLKDSVRLLFWSGQSFEEIGLKSEGKFKASEIRYTRTEQVNLDDLKRWLMKSESIQWDYKNLVKKRGVLDRLY